MSDSELLALLRSIDKHNDRVRAIVGRIAESGRADAAKLAADLNEQCVQWAHAEHVGGEYLNKRNWEFVDGTYSRARSTKLETA